MRKASVKDCRTMREILHPMRQRESRGRYLQRRLASTVSTGAGVRQEVGHRADVDDAPLAFTQQRQERLRDRVDAEEVDVEEAPDRIDVFQLHGETSADSRVVHQAHDGFLLALRVRRHLLRGAVHLRFLGHVEEDRPDGWELRRDPLHVLLLPHSCVHGEALLVQRHRGVQADARRRPGDDHNALRWHGIRPDGQEPQPQGQESQQRHHDHGDTAADTHLLCGGGRGNRAEG
eukprot:scaffold1712_cov261-Pinguiococcus_pyrenoidosus.AAC.1